jgi:hypothetical protein
MQGVRSRGSLVVMAVVATFLGLVPTQAAKPREVPLADYSLAFGEIAQLWSPPVGTGFPRGWWPEIRGATPPAGTWSVTDIRFIEARFIDLHVVVTPPPPALIPAANAGPAVLFTTLGLYGGFGGDTGFQRLVSVQHVGLPACADDPCRFESDVRVDARWLQRVARSVDGLRASTALIGFDLVRTYAGGSWLQSNPAYDVVIGPDGPARSPSPRTGSARLRRRASSPGMGLPRRPKGPTAVHPSATSRSSMRHARRWATGRCRCRPLP